MQYTKYFDIRLSRKNELMMSYSEFNDGMGFRGSYFDVNKTYLAVAGTSAQYPWCPRSKTEKNKENKRLPVPGTPSVA